MTLTIEEINNAPIGTRAWAYDYNRGSGSWIKIHENQWRREDPEPFCKPDTITDEEVNKKLRHLYNKERADYNVGLSYPIG